MGEQDRIYRTMFAGYPDVLTVKQVCEMIGGISEKTAYRLIHSGKVRHIEIGRSIRIPKIFLIDYLISTT